ncbi:acylphosphatase-1-like [Daktulosphaira vitifoliae]|uniref:acylphosphatase-1-like n=1 Tax=Daktulosphaira vitifoliae TaxID=58002 RepID=UPI0021AA0748|nr:acylphosphatase-1-like [Daktulosphaira vitifoliae]
MTTNLLSVDFEVFGTVQRVFFRKFTQEQGKLLGLRGWCKNTTAGTVIGTFEGPSDKVETMKKWLQTVGSPASRIDRVEFTSEKIINDYTFTDFDVIRKKLIV